MNRPLLTSLAVGLGLVCCVYALVPARAQERGAQDRGQRDVRRTDDRDRSDDRDRGDDRAIESATERLDKALQTYQTFREKMGPNVEQTRKEIQKFRDDLCDVIKLRCDLAMSLAEIRADFAGAEMMGAAPGTMRPYRMTMGPAGSRVSYGSVGEPSEGRSDQSSHEEHQLIHRQALDRELRVLHEQLRAEVDQAQAQADQLGAQLRDLRVQQRQWQEQMKAEKERQRQMRERSKESKTDDGSRPNSNRDQNPQIPRPADPSSRGPSSN